MYPDFVTERLMLRLLQESEFDHMYLLDSDPSDVITM